MLMELLEPKKLDFAETFKDALTIGVKNAPSIIAAVALWLVTIWIPYLNVGTTIAITMLPTELAKGTVINPLGIFDSKYRRCMGEFLLATGLQAVGVYAAMIFLFFPGIVLALSWSLAYYYLLEKGKNPVDALRASNEATYGSKWMMFGINAIFAVTATIASCILLGICSAIDIGFLTFVVTLGLVILIASIGMAIKASFWRQLKDNAA